MMFRRRACALALGAVLLAPPALGADPADKKAEDDALVVERIVAVVDTDVVLLSEVEEALDLLVKAQPPPAGSDRLAYRDKKRAEVIDTLVAEKLLEREIKKLRIDVSEPEIERALEATKAQYNLDDAAFEMALAQQGMSLKDYKDGIKKQLLKLKIVELKVKSRVQIRDQDVKSTYAKKKAVAQKDFKVRARHILFVVGEGADENAKRALAERAMARVKAGEPFEKVASEMSEGPSKKSGGSLGVFGKGEMLPAFEEAAFAAAPGDVVGPVRTQVGWHVILVEERVAGQVVAADQAEQQLREQLYEEEMERAFRRYIDELKQQSYIEVRSAQR